MSKIIYLFFVLLSNFVQAVGYADLDESIQSYALPVEHSLRPALDRLFRDPKTLQNQKNLEKAGFVVLHSRPSTLIIAKHPALAGYLIKVYLLSSVRPQKENWENLVNRCRGAENIRKLIKQEGLKYFTVPDKWLYVSSTGDPVLVLIATHIDTVSKEDSKYAWKHSVSYKHLEELYCIISHGYASTLLPANIPYTKKGIFACVDTEQPQREPRYENVKVHISKKMRLYWEELVRTGEP